ncbi:MAG TPA: PTS sugar transporter subunit IIA [Thermodesulforhabdus norvegica]|uniref:PTS sugar transporter subunit IIA n=1 Tax=Thermodesulforhabdus norvegica TaxID=39841 RepID=A0A7C1AYV3_9BACT|nr:PTS sugar transporter subunit IIA [Deltaproteobacteria bacterium]MBW2067796.1 PTS sugar transporter subunit IIA [Deltaproteobacteria bacterium]HDL90428.1 PTS sugar transporter subunit IIA [Thermodesulforhabdus norvegica]
MADVKNGGGSNTERRVGIIVAAHLGLATEFLRVAELILGRLEGVYAVEMKPNMSSQDIVRLFEQTIHEADEGAGVIILTDIFGGTPTNVALAFSGKSVDVVSGFNLPMILRAYSLCRQQGKNLEEVALDIQHYARRQITRANELVNPES